MSQDLRRGVRVAINPGTDPTSEMLDVLRGISANIVLLDDVPPEPSLFSCELPPPVQNKHLKSNTRSKQWMKDSKRGKISCKNSSQRRAIRAQQRKITTKKR